MRRPRLLAVDLDRTLLPNGSSEEDASARPLFADVVDDLELTLAYVTGRRLELVEEALVEYAIPRPDFVLADVGTSLYGRNGEAWTQIRSWADRLAEEWGGRRACELTSLFADESELTLQEPEAQGIFKLSYFTPSDVDVQALRERMHGILDRHGLRAAVIHSVDEAADRGLVDVLPEFGTKLHGLEFLMEERGLTAADVVFCGDSGNDFEILVSALPAVLVANASEELRERVLEEAHARGLAERLYVARGGLLGMNGNYGAGILEGWVHFHPEDEARLVELARVRSMRSTGSGASGGGA